MDPVYREIDRKDPRTWPELWHVPGQGKWFIRNRSFHTVHAPVLSFMGERTGRFNDIMFAPGLMEIDYFASFQAFSRLRPDV